jgi:8-oxo-dGTP pyrophosphatase MutT (NUDIX family)
MSMRPPPWKALSTRIIYENAWIKLREDQVIAPSGAQGIYSVVESRLAVGVLVFDLNEDIYLVGQQRYPTQCYSWEIPEGGADHGEDPLHAAQRELREETGISAQQWERLGGEIHLSNCFTSERGLLFTARGLSFSERNLDPTEDIAVRRVSFSQALDMVSGGEITDALSIIAILRFAVTIHRGL